mmetsp:Transcript_23831/g.54231  ORF Transcript_23831/g.54231 Transcript_23831/m.54231 type:complete len:129 (-) Transcript_23831:473-859(-)
MLSSSHPWNYSSCFMGWLFLIAVLVLWAVIILFDLHRAGDCDNESENCGRRPWTFVLMMVGINLISALAVNDAALLIAKLYKSLHKLSVGLRRARAQRHCKFKNNWFNQAQLPSQNNWRTTFKQQGTM